MRNCKEESVPSSNQIQILLSDDIPQLCKKKYYRGMSEILNLIKNEHRREMLVNRTDNKLVDVLISRSEQ